jgi:nitroreductase
MEFREVVRRRRMVRRFSQRPVPGEVIDRILDVGRRGPSAGFAQGVDFLVLDTTEQVRTFWETTRDPDGGWDPAVIEHGPPVLVLPLPDAGRYLERYSQPDKIDLGMDLEEHWPVRFWEVDAAMAAMSILYAAVDEGLGGWFFGITNGEREMLDAFGVPQGLRPIGIVGLGYRADDEEPSGSWMRRRRRSFEEQVHRNRW